MTSHVNMATPIHFIDGKYHKKYLKAGKSCGTCLTNRTWPISCHWLLMPLGADTQTHTHTHTDTQFQETMHTWPLAVQAWFKKDITQTCTLVK